MITKKTAGIALGGCIAGGMLALGASRALASGIPATNALTYSGFLEDSAGAPVDGSRSIAVELWDAASGGSKLCERTSAATTVTNGRFAVQLPDACTAAVTTYADTWVEVLVAGASLGRTKLGAVPYAVEANGAATLRSNPSGNVHIDSSSSGSDGRLYLNWYNGKGVVIGDGAQNTVATVDATGIHSATLDGYGTRIASLEGASPSKSGFRAQQTGAQAVTSGVTATATFDAEDFDLGDEYDPSTSTFTTKSGGYYEIGCSQVWNLGATGTVGYWDAVLAVNNNRALTGDGGYSDGQYAKRNARGIFRLAPGDAVTCQASQNSGITVALLAGATAFDAIRLAL